MPMTMTQMLGLVGDGDGEIDFKRKDVQEAQKRARMYQYINTSLKNIADERNQPPENFLFGAANEPGPENIDPDAYQIASEENPTKQGGFDEMMTYLASKINPEGVKQRQNLYSAISSLSPAAFERTGATMPAAERMTAMAEFQPDPGKEASQFDAKIDYGRNTLLPMRAADIGSQLRATGASQENVNKYLQEMGLLFPKKQQR